MAGNGGAGIGRKWFPSGGDVACAIIERRQFFPHVDDAQIHCIASQRTSEVLSRCSQTQPESRALEPWLNGQQSHIGPRSSLFDVDASHHARAVLGCQEVSLGEELAHIV